MEEEKAWLKGTANPVDGKSYEAVRIPAQPGIFSRLGFTRRRLLIGSVVIIGVWFVMNAKNGVENTGMSFVQANGLQFYADCRPFYPAGFNTHDLVQAALMTTYDYNMRKSGRARIREMMAQASGSGLNLLRTWAHTNHEKFPFQDRPGEYNENTFRALDYILDEARKHGMRVILSFVDNWKYYNGVDQYVDWSDSVPVRGSEHKRPKDKDGDPTPLAFDNEEIKKYEVQRHSLFYTDAGTKQMYKNHVEAIVNRKNHISGVLYKDDPTIFAWDLLNEPRCESYVVKECPTLVQAWIEEMSAYVKQVDTNHMVTIGSEGFFSEDSPYVSKNPADWAQQMGQNWTGNHMPTHIDFATIHVWPDNWLRTEPEFQQDWITSHIEAVSKINKPLLLEEFGKRLDGKLEDSLSAIKQKRDPVYLQTYSTIEKAMEEGQNIQGSLYWRWNMPLFANQGRGDYGVRPGDSTFEYVIRHTGFINALTNSRPPDASCPELGCWVPVTSGWSRSCKNMPEICAKYWANPKDAKLDVRMYASQLACCRPGQGAFASGCSWSFI